MWLINWLDLIGSGLVLCGLAWGGWKLVRRRLKLERERDAAREIHRESEEARKQGRDYDRDAEHRRRGVRPGLTGNDLASIQQEAELVIVNYLRPELKGPFVVTALGTLFSAARALLLVCGFGA